MVSYEADNKKIEELNGKVVTAFEKLKIHNIVQSVNNDL